MTTVPSQKLLTRGTGAAREVYRSVRNVPSGAFDSGAAGLIEGGRQLGKFGDQAAQLELQMQQDDNDAEVKKLDNEMSETIRQITYGDEETPGYYSTQKQDALDNFVTTEDRIKQAVADVQGRASNDAVKRRVGELGMNRSEREFDGMSRHAAAERIKAHDETSVAREAQATADAASAWNSDTVADTSLGIIKDENDDYAERHGMSEEAKQARLMERQSVLIKETFTAAVANSDMQRAQEIFDRFVGTGTVQGPIEAEMRKTLDAGILREKSQRETARIQSANPGDLKAQIEAAKQIEDPKVQDEVVSRLDNDHARNRRIDEQARVEARRDAWQDIIGGGSVDNMSADKLATLDGTVIASMRNFEKRRAQSGSGYAKATKAWAYNEVHSKFMEDPLEFSQADLTKYIDHLDEGDFKYWQAQQRSIDKSAAKEAQRRKSYTMADRMAKEYLNSADIGYTSSATPTDAVKAQKVLRLARDYVDELEQGEKFDRTELDARLSELFLSGEVSGSGLFFTDKGRAFEFEGTGQGEDFVITDVEDQTEQISAATGIPEDRVEGAARALDQMGVPVTTENLRGGFEIENSEGREAHIAALTGVPVRYVGDVVNALRQRGKKVTPANIRSVYNSAAAKAGSK